MSEIVGKVAVRRAAPAAGLVGVHGIANDAADRARMQPMLVERLEKHGKIALFRDVEGPPRVWTAPWRSLGRFPDDLASLRLYESRRAEAVADVADGIRSALSTQASSGGPLLVVGHSMGQVLSVLALRKLLAGWPNQKPPVPVALLTLGGPLGNRNPLDQRYLSGWAYPPADFPGQSVVRWVDAYNTDDPVPTGWPTWLFGYRKPPGAHEALRVDWPGSPTPLDPFAEHGSYFDAPAVFSKIGELVERLRPEPGPETAPAPATAVA